MDLEFMFPVLSVEACAKGLEANGISVREEDFRKPESNRWFGIYEMILQAITEMPLESIIQNAEFQAKDSFEYYELHDESLPVILLTSAIQRFLRSCSIQDFTIRDLFFPKPKRLIQICSAVVNFLYHKQGRMETFRCLKEENTKFKEQYDSLRKANEQMKRKIMAIKSAEAEQEPYIKEAQEEVDNLNQRIESHYKLKDQQQKIINDLNAAIAERKARTDQIRVKKAKLKEECENISRKIIQSPERVMADEEKAKEKVYMLKNSIDRKRGVLMEKQQIIEGIDSYILNAEKAHKMLQDINVDVDKENEIDREILTISDKCQEQKSQLDKFGSKQDQLQHLMNSRQEKLSKVNFYHQQKTKSFQENLKQLQDEMELYKRKNDDDEKKKNSILQEKQCLLQDLAQKQRSLDSKVEEVQNIYSEIIKKLDLYNSSLGEGWEQLKLVLSTVK